MEPDSLSEALILPAADTLPISPVFSVDTAADYSFRFEIVSQIPDSEFIQIYPDWAIGLEPEQMPVLPGNNSGFILVLAVLIALVLFNFRSFIQILSFNVDELVSVRRGRDNVFDERPAAITVLQIILVGLFCVCGGFLLTGGIGDIGETPIGPQGLWFSIFIILAYYLVELCAYSLVGFTFSSDEGRREWLRGYTASISLLSLTLVIPALIGMFYPEFLRAMSILALVLFIFAKIMFILKGFRIFFENFFSLLYFILYLCTLEIIPIILVYNCSMEMMF